MVSYFLTEKLGYKNTKKALKRLFIKEIMHIFAIIQGALVINNKGELSTIFRNSLAFIRR